MSNDNDIKHPTSPVAIDNDPTGVYICARDAEVWHRALKLALDPYKAPEIRWAVAIVAGRRCWVPCDAPEAA